MKNQVIGSLKPPGEGDDLVGGEVADEAPGHRALGLGERGLRPAHAQVGLQGERRLVLCPSPPLPRLGEVEGHYLVGGEADERRQVGLRGAWLGFLTDHACPLRAVPCPGMSISYHYTNLPVDERITRA